MFQAEQRPSSSERSAAESFLYYLSILFRYRWLVVGITAVTTIAVAAYCVLSVRLPPDKSPLPNIYTAQAVILVQQGSDVDIASTIFAALGVEGRSTGGGPAFDNAALLEEVLRSRAILDPVIDQLNVVERYHISKQARNASRLLLIRKTFLNYNKATGSLAISFKDTDPVFASAVVNKMVALLNDWYIQYKGSANKKQMELLEQKTTEVQGMINDLEARLKANTAEFSSGQKNIPELQQQFTELTRELDVQRKIYDTLSHQYEVLKLTPEPASVFQVLEAAEVPDAKSGPQRSKIIMNGFLYSFVASIALAFVLHFVRKIAMDPKLRAVLRSKK